MLTEQQAKEKWCPFVRGSIVNSGVREMEGYNRVIVVAKNEVLSNPPECRCIASECMAWRWSRDALGRPEKVDGYCGLAGKE